MFHVAKSYIFTSSLASTLWIDDEVVLPPTRGMGSSSDRMDDGLGSVECDLRSYALWCTDWRRGATDCDRRAPDDAFRVIDGCWRCSPWGWAAPLSSRRDAADSHVVLYRGSFISVARGGRPLTTVGAKHIRTLRVSPRVHPLYPLLRLPVLLGL